MIPLVKVPFRCPARLNCKIDVCEMVKLLKVIAPAASLAVFNLQRALYVGQRTPGGGVAVDIDLAAAFEVDVALGCRERGSRLQSAAVQFDCTDQFWVAAIVAKRSIAHHVDGRRADIADDDVAIKIRAWRRQDQRPASRSAATAEVVDGKRRESRSLRRDPRCHSRA